MPLFQVVCLSEIVFDLFCTPNSKSNSFLIQSKSNEECYKVRYLKTEQVS